MMNNDQSIKFVLRCSGIFLLLTLCSGLQAQQASEIGRQFHQQQSQRILADFVDLLTLPNVANDLDNMQRNAQWIEAYITKRGFTSQIVEAGGAPYVIAERKASDSAPVVLIYAHFDGQPVIPEDWASPPFTPTLWTDIPDLPNASVLDMQQTKYEDDWRLVARSAGDDKGPVIALMAAIDALVAADAMPDITIKLFLDGEEEIGSPTLKGILTKTAEQLSADILLFCDGPMHQSRRRQVVLGVRGSMTIDLTTYGANRPLHSGHYGNWARNPNETMMQILTSMKDVNGMPTVKGFTDTVTPISPAEIAAIDAMPRIDKPLAVSLGLSGGEAAGERIEAAIMRPAIVIKGLYGGGVKDKARNVIESTANASLNIRLVPGQTPEQVVASLKAHISALGFSVSEKEPTANALRNQYVKFVTRPGAYRAFRTPIEEPAVKQLVSILDKLPGDDTLITPTLGGSLPIYLFEDMLDMPIVILPIANHDNNQHGRNENIRLKNFFDAIEIYAEIIDGFGTP